MDIVGYRELITQRNARTALNGSQRRRSKLRQQIKRVNYVDDLPKDAIHSIKMLQDLFKGTSFESQVNEQFIRNYNEGKERGIGE